jgi:hypothetical protein
VSFDVATLTSIAGAIGVGSILGGWVTGSKDRRSVRAAALAALGSVERARWAESCDFPAFRQTTRDLETAALLARIPRAVVREYLILAMVARWDSDESNDIDPEMTGRNQCTSGRRRPRSCSAA